jgi:hypothetical protein
MILQATILITTMQLQAALLLFYVRDAMLAAMFQLQLIMEMDTHQVQVHQELVTMVTLLVRLHLERMAHRRLFMDGDTMKVV